LNRAAQDANKAYEHFLELSEKCSFFVQGQLLSDGQAEIRGTALCDLAGSLVRTGANSSFRAVRLYL
ncbi:MAG: hypothetical protein LUH36_03065, partial [Oscillospiraceae bacterium]|nr:hypothetical protein [Oscillospiraceae bacterium]